MKFKKFIKFISGYFLEGVDISTICECAYQPNRKAIFKLGSYEELCALISILNEIKGFHQSKRQEIDL